ncbi:hypothetical protein [Sporomusa acidovorans]|uniref:Uncharacterized protein n=1 Tax=Sporomusa acidovorans (strain ATCC 49682 / DSM 3132 / Mol) TaxID=1123286 RepID=A0ABZ3IX22_SPOA4|nr:hypothetical protein [Sporomusa acidovorans]OZC23304.1 hypothetical protein SPACI_07160 [Sporomusa acidovorans DSM 3132]SDE41290.1 hypothetical protein SAMN04488499_101318 [Sporomusa acidovorans]
MSNQILFWSILVLPWLTLIFMKKETIKRFMPVALFSTLASVLAVEVGENLGWFIYEAAASPLRTGSYIIFGLNPVITIWLFHFIYGKFWTYLLIDTVLNFGFIYLFHVYFLGSRGLFQEIGITPSLNALITTIVGVMAYGYQVWQEEIFACPEKAGFKTNLQPATAKPLQNEKENPHNDK